MQTDFFSEKLCKQANKRTDIFELQ